MENLLYAAAVLGSLCDGHASNPAVVAGALRHLSALDQQLQAGEREVMAQSLQGARGANESLSTLEEKVDALLSAAENQVQRLRDLGLRVRLHYDPVGRTGNSRLFLVVPRTCWNEDAPLFVN